MAVPALMLRNNRFVCLIVFSKYIRLCTSILSTYILCKFFSWASSSFCCINM